MFFNTIILAVSSSIDSLSIGITYGINNTKISNFAKLVLFLVSFCFSTISIWLGNFIKSFFSNFFANCIGTCILIFMGLFIVFQAINNPKSSDLDNSNDIDAKESLILGIALSLDSICIGIGGSIIGINPTFFPFLVSIFQFVFLWLGIFSGFKLRNFFKVSDNIWSIISGILLIVLGISKLLV